MLCEHNRDGDSYRSPWSNTYFPPLNDGLHPSQKLRQLELHANEVFNIYKELYYGKSSSSVSSVYLWDKEEEESSQLGGFAGCFLIQNRTDDGNSWNSIHVIDVGNVQKNNGKCTYRLTSTILLSITPLSNNNHEEEGEKVPQQSSSTNITGSLIRQHVRECNVINVEEDGCNSSSSSHIINIGHFIEDVENEMRSEMDSLYIQKTKTVVEMIRKDTGPVTQGAEHTRVLNEAVLAMAMAKKANIK